MIVGPYMHIYYFGIIRMSNSNHILEIIFMNCTEDFYRYKALHYEALVGDKKDRESVRVNDQYRIEFHSEVVGNEKQITICNILELSNHYK